MDLAYCGLNCMECPVYPASISKNTAEQIRLANEYSTDTGRFSKEDMASILKSLNPLRPEIF